MSKLLMDGASVRALASSGPRWTDTNHLRDSISAGVPQSTLFRPHVVSRGYAADLTEIETSADG